MYKILRFIFQFLSSETIPLHYSNALSRVLYKLILSRVNKNSTCFTKKMIHRRVPHTPFKLSVSNAEHAPHSLIL